MCVITRACICVRLNRTDSDSAAWRVPHWSKCNAVKNEITTVKNTQNRSAFHKGEHMWYTHRAHSKQASKQAITGNMKSSCRAKYQTPKKCRRNTFESHIFQTHWNDKMTRDFIGDLQYRLFFSIFGIQCTVMGICTMQEMVCRCAGEM